MREKEYVHFNLFKFILVQPVCEFMVHFSFWLGGGAFFTLVW
jgi:hypothetical protein